MTCRERYALSLHLVKNICIKDKAPAWIPTGAHSGFYISPSYLLFWAWVEAFTFVVRPIRGLYRVWQYMFQYVFLKDPQR